MKRGGIPAEDGHPSQY